MYINHHNMLKSFASDYINIYIYGKSSFPLSQPQLLCNICAKYNHTYISENATACKGLPQQQLISSIEFILWPTISQWHLDQYRRSAQATLQAKSHDRMFFTLPFTINCFVLFFFLNFNFILLHHTNKFRKQIQQNQ